MTTRKLAYLTLAALAAGLAEIALTGQHHLINAAILGGIVCGARMIFAAKPATEPSPEEERQ